MPGPLTVNDATATLDTLRAHWRFTLSRLKSDPNGAPYVADLSAFEASWDAADKKERMLDDAVAHAEAGAVFADGGLDRLVDQVTVAIHGGKKPNLSLPLNRLYFGALTPSQLKRPILGTELAQIHGWPQLLGQASQPELSALAPAAAAAMQPADAAAGALSKALSERDTFRLSGDRTKLFDAFNALTARTHAGLKALALEHPELKLGTTYAESFFLHSTGSRFGKTVAEASAAADKLKAKAANAQKHHDALVAKAAAHEAALKEHEKAKADLAVAKRLTADAKKAQKAAALKAKKKPPK